MVYSLTPGELARFKNALAASISIPFIDDVEDYVVEAIWGYAKNVDCPDPFYNTRTKMLFDVVDNNNKVGWSVKSLQWNLSDECQFELVIQRADVYKKANTLGFSNLSSESNVDDIGVALLRHWERKVNADAIAQKVNSKRILVLLKSNSKDNYAIYEDDLRIYSPSELRWVWTNENKSGLQGIRKSDNTCVYRWYPSQKQLFERFILPPEAPRFSINPLRMTKDCTVNLLLSHLQSR